MLNANLLRASVIEKGYSTQSFAEELGCSRSALYRKITGRSEFTQSEIARIISLLELTNERAVNIFFAESVS